MAANSTKRRGIFLSLDVSIALLLLFMSVMLAFTYYSNTQGYSFSTLASRAYMQDVATVLSNRGDLSAPLAAGTRPDTKGISEVLAATPASLCLQVEAHGVILPDGLVGYWKLDEDSGATTAADASGNGATGAIYGGTFPGQISPSGKGYLFNASGSYIEANSTALNGLSQFTESVWVRFRTLPTATPVIVGRGSFDGAIFLSQTGSVAGVQTGSSSALGTTNLAPNTWYHVAATYDGNLVRLYLDGRQESSYAYSSSLGAANSFIIGALTSGTYNFNGSIDEVRVYSRALNASEVARLYSNPTNILYVVSKPDCEYSSGDTQILQIPFSSNPDQDRNGYYYANVKSWAKGAATAQAQGGANVSTGGSGQLCNADGSCNTGYACTFGVCQACGNAAGASCCTGSYCDTGFACNLSSNSCQLCGSTGQLCCASSLCSATFSCNTTVTPQYTCQSCGGSGQLCCAGDNCSSAFACNTSVSPLPVCQSCGAAAGQLCCLNATSGLYSNCAAGAGLSCNASASPQPVCYGTSSDGSALSSCANLSTPNTVYNLTQSVSINGSTCFNVTAQNVTLNCAGYSATGNNSAGTYGVYSNQFNTTVQNCIISNFSTGIYFTGATNGAISGTAASTTYSGGSGITLVSSSSSNRISASSGTSNSGPGIFLSGSSSNTISSSAGTSNSSRGIYLDTGSNSNQIFSSTGTSTSNYGILLSSSSNNTITNSTGTGSVSGVYISSSSNNTILNSTTSSIGLWESMNNFISNSILGDGGLSLMSSSTGNTFVLNNFTSATSGVYVYDGGGGNYFNATINGINQGNIYQDVVSGAVQVSGTTPSSISGLYVGSSGTGYPYNSTTSGGKMDGATDYAPLTPNATSCTAGVNTDSSNGQVQSTCMCGSLLMSSNYCCGGKNSTTPCCLDIGSTYHVLADPAADFGTTQGQNNWYYYRSAPGSNTYTSLIYFTPEWAVGNPHSSYEYLYSYYWNATTLKNTPGDPGGYGDVVDAWKSTYAGAVTIKAVISDANGGGGDGITYSIKKNTGSLFSQSYSNGFGVTAITQNTTLAINDTVYFRINGISESGYDNTWQAARICAALP